MNKEPDFSGLRVRKLEPDYYLAIHEAGHAVASVILNLDLRAVTLHPPAEIRDGFTTIGLTVTLGQSAKDEQKLVLSACGIIAEVKARTEDSPDTFFRELPGILLRGKDDVETCNKLWTQLEAKEKDLGDRVLGQAPSLVADNWDEIDVVACRLVEFGTLSGEDVKAIMEYLEHF